MEPIRSEFSYHLPASPERVWPIVADTEMVNRRIGLPATRARALQTEPVRVVRVSARVAGLRLEWDEDPFDFVEGDHFWVRRKMQSGPVREFNGGARFIRTPDGVSVIVESEFLPASALGAILVRGLVRKVRGDWDRLIEEARLHLESPEAAPFMHDRSLPAVEERTRRRLAAAAPLLAGERLAPKLFDYLASASDRELVRIRPFSLAREWDEDRYDVLRLFLRAAHRGVLDLSWDVMCPNCLGTPARLQTLEALETAVHCEDCQITFDADFDRAVEVTFHPNARYRAVDNVVYCSGGPRNTPHIVAQKVLAPGEEFRCEVSLAAGRYRVRNLTADLSASVHVVDDHPPEGPVSLFVKIDDSAIILTASSDPTPAGAVTTRVVNDGSARQQVILERMASYEDCLMAATVSVYQEFRSLFGSEVLSPDAQLSIQTLPLLFTDVKGSTALYGKLGEATAYALVRDHFALLREVVARHHGGVVKTIGDAVMAAFPTAIDAVGCALAIHEDLRKFNESGRSPLRLKVGLHQGPCIAVRGDDDRLDYFGSTVNLAARVHAESQGDDIVITEAMISDPDVIGLLAGRRQETFTAILRGMGETRLIRVHEEQKDGEAPASAGG